MFDDTENATLGSSFSNAASNVVTNMCHSWQALALQTKTDIACAFLSVSFAVLIRILVLEPRYIPSLSMYPTFHIGDHVLIDKISSRLLKRPYVRGDIVLFHPTRFCMNLKCSGKPFIKRVVGIGGDVVEIRNKRLYVNGAIQEELYINELIDYSLAARHVPLGTVFVLGDNRNDSFDSHIWGALPEKYIVGRAVCKYWPASRVGVL